ncbi:MAG: hypothetical protein K8I27_11645 [Planctomycetes bacterium]|nr:hypothetical protein [Planctomycetota bacterium]
MKRFVAAALFALGIGLSGFWLGQNDAPEVAAQDKPAKPAKIANLEAYLNADEAYKAADLAGRCAIIEELKKEQKTDWTTARGMQMRLLLVHARANEMDPATNLVAFVQWIGAHTKDWKDPLSKACSGTGSLNALLETYGAQRLYRDETFLKGDSEAKLRRIKELWEARELDQSQCYDLTRMYIYAHLAAADGDINKELELFGKLHRAECTDWAGASSVHEALMTRALEEKKELDTVEKKLAWLAKAADNNTGDLSWMTVSNRRLTLFMHAMDKEMGGLDSAARKAKIAEWKEKGLLAGSDASNLESTYCVNE